MVRLLKDYAENDADLRRVAVLCLSGVLPSDECQDDARDVLSEEEFRRFLRAVAIRDSPILITPVPPRAENEDPTTRPAH